jgi:anaerobic magnesium-protoporphyrin IX monomethyl ester cyclase
MPNTAMLVAYQDHENLGVGYLASVVQESGFRPMLVDFRLGSEAILELARARDPLVIGFSIIFQYYTPDFQELMDYLRRHGVSCHFTAGGHYPSLRCREVLQRVSQLDSIVMFEGEWTFLELVQTLERGEDWRTIHGLAYRNGEQVVVNPLRPLEPDLDRFPAPLRPPVRHDLAGKKVVHMLAARGCLYNCSFCSIRQFYSAPPGPLKRVRQPAMVVREMELLHEEYGASIFLFQDDDFPGAARNGAAWAKEFAALLTQKGLDNRLMWKISCRADEIERERFSRLRDAGLLIAYLGIESATDTGLKLMNKRVKAETNLRAIEILRELGIHCDFGFMIFDPSSTLDSVQHNLNFLDAVCGDGHTCATGCKMIPYAETAIEHQLKQEGRLILQDEHENYHFLDSATEELYEWFANTFGHWVEDPEGVLSHCRLAKHRLAVLNRCEPFEKNLHAIQGASTRLVSRANLLLTRSMRQAISILASQDDDYVRAREFSRLGLEVAEQERQLNEELASVLASIENLACLPGRQLS